MAPNPIKPAAASYGTTPPRFDRPTGWAFTADSRPQGSVPEPGGGLLVSVAVGGVLRRACDRRRVRPALRAAAAESVTVGGYRRTWLKRHPRTERTNKNYAGRVDGQLDVELEGVKFRDWPMDEIRRRHATDLLDNTLREQKRAAKGAQGILRVLSAMWHNAIEDDRAEFNPSWASRSVTTIRGSRGRRAKFGCGRGRRCTLSPVRPASGSRLSRPVEN
jgi:hypothetical protein